MCGVTFENGPVIVDFFEKVVDKLWKMGTVHNIAVFCFVLALRVIVSGCSNTVVSDVSGGFGDNPDGTSKKK